jgi:hypothetical protein
MLSERERGRDRKRDAVPRAGLGQPFRSPLSPRARHIQGDVSIDSGEWTVERRRSRRARRQAVEGRDRFEQNQRFKNGDKIVPQDRSTSSRSKHMLTSMEREHWLYRQHRPHSRFRETHDLWRQEPFDRNRPVLYQNLGE